MQTACLHPCSLPTQQSLNTAPVLHLSFLLSKSDCPLAHLLPPSSTLCPCLPPQLCFPATAHISRCRSSSGLWLPLAAHLPLLWHHLPQHSGPPREGRTGVALYQGLPLAAECSSPPCRWRSSSDAKGYIALRRRANTVWPRGGPLMKMDSSVHSKLLNPIAILNSVQSS